MGTKIDHPYEDVAIYIRFTNLKAKVMINFRTP